jgi:predicted amidophosphoribosyltransferase
MKKCPNCSKKITRKEIFCPYCGKKLKENGLRTLKDDKNDKATIPPWFDPRQPL